MFGRSGLGDILVSVVEQSDVAPAEQLSKALGISVREGEALNWLAKGKNNKEIAAILILIPRNVPKRIEQIFKKIEVENRISAAAIALGQLARPTGAI